MQLTHSPLVVRERVKMLKSMVLTMCVDVSMSHRTATQFRCQASTDGRSQSRGCASVCVIFCIRLAK